MATRNEGNSSITRAMSLIREAAAVLNNNSPENRENSSSSTGSSLNAVDHWNINTNTSNSAIRSSTSTSCTPVTNVCANTPNTQETFRNFHAGHSNINTINASNSVLLPSTSSTAVTTLPNTPSTEGALRNFRTLFAPYASTSSLSLGASSRPPPKRVCRRKESKGKTRDTWTHEMFCLANTDEEATPSRERKITLQLAGLGRIKIKFDANANAVEFKNKLEETFPKLICGGGFELLRRGPSGNGLVLVRQPPIGYTVKYLRDVCGIGQALLYIRPLQMDLDTSSEETTTTEQDAEVKRRAVYIQMGGGGRRAAILCKV